jgi:hypothetical protein
MHLIHALLLALGVLAVTRAGEVIFARNTVFWLAGALATGALLADADMFSFLMTESVTFSLHSLTMLALAMGWTTSKRRYFVMAGLGLGVLCLVRFSYLVAALIIPALIFLSARFFLRSHRWTATSVLMFALAFLAVLLPWAIRNAVSGNRPARGPAHLRGGRHDAFPVRCAGQLLSDRRRAAVGAGRRVQADRPDHRRAVSR